MTDCKTSAELCSCSDISVTVEGVGAKGADGATFTPSVVQVEGGHVIKWSNDAGLPNPDPVEVRDGKDGADGKPGKDGVDGKPGKDGKDGATYAPTQTETPDGVLLEWSNSQGLPNPPAVLIRKGEKGDRGSTGQQGRPGADGEKGDQGKPGRPGADGAPGKDGKTPVFGVDYFTPEQVKQVEDDTLARLPIDDERFTPTNLLSASGAVDAFGCHDEIIGERVEFTPVTGVPIKVRARIDAKQNGSGEPSPTNQRDIFGWNSISISHGNLGKDHVFKQDFDGFVYGGTFDSDGALRITHDMRTFNGSENWVKKVIPNGRGTYMFMLEVPGLGASDNLAEQLCNIFATHPSVLPAWSFAGVWAVADAVYVGAGIAANYPEAADWKAFLQSNNMQILYERTEAVSKKYEPMVIRGYEGGNYVTCSTGECTVETFTKVCPQDVDDVEETAILAIEMATTNGKRIEAVEKIAKHADKFADNQPHATKRGTLVNVHDAFPAVPRALVAEGETRVNLWEPTPSQTYAGVTFTQNGDGSVKIEGTPTAAYVQTQADYLGANPSTTYTLMAVGGVGSFAQAVGACYAWVTVRGDATPEVGYWSFGNAVTFTTPSDLNRLRCLISCGSDLTTARNATIYPMLVEGSHALPWTPSGLTSVAELACEVRGRNLIREITPGVLQRIPRIRSGAEVTFSALGLENGTAKAFAYDSSKNYIGGFVLQLIDGKRTNATKTFQTDACYISSYTGDNIGACAEHQLELGPAATPYEPYTATTYPIDLQGHELCSLPDGTRDEVEVDEAGDVWLVKNVPMFEMSYSGDVVGFSMQTGTMGEKYGVCTLNRLIVKGLELDNQLAMLDGNPYTVANPYTESGSCAWTFSADGTKSLVRIRLPEEYQTADQYRDFLRTHVLSFYYRAETPTRIPLGHIDLANLPAPVASLWAETNVSGSQSRLDYTQDLNIVLDDIRQAIAALPSGI